MKSQGRPNGVIPVRTRPARRDRRWTTRLNGRKVFVLAASAAVLLMPAQSEARPGVPVESQLTQGVGAPIPPNSSTGALTEQIFQSIRHWREQPRIVAGVPGPATATSTAERLSPPPTIALPLTVEEIIRDVFPDDIEDRAVRIAWRESRFVPTARNSCCFGILQIHKMHLAWLCPELGICSTDQLLDARTNAEAAYALYLRDGWAPWRQ